MRVRGYLNGLNPITRLIDDLPAWLHLQHSPDLVTPRLEVVGNKNTNFRHGHLQLHSSVILHLPLRRRPDREKTAQRASLRRTAAVLPC